MHEMLNVLLRDRFTQLHVVHEYVAARFHLLFLEHTLNRCCRSVEDPFELLYLRDLLIVIEVQLVQLRLIGRIVVAEVLQEIVR